MRPHFIPFVILLMALTLPAQAGEVTVAVAANFLNPAKAIVQAFERATCHQVLVVPGSSGKLYAQITHGAPFDVLLSADAERPLRLEQEGLGVAGTRFTYALGRLTLWSRDPQRLAGRGSEALRLDTFRHVAIANPKTAPYGEAAVQVMQALGVWDRLRPRLVQGENIGQAFQFVASGNAEVGFVALSQVLDPRIRGAGSRWDVPPELHEPLKQDAVLLTRGASNPAARALWEFVQGPEARQVIKLYGYDLAKEE